jgi:hypothetical protein
MQPRDPRGPARELIAQGRASGTRRPPCARRGKPDFLKHPEEAHPRRNEVSPRDYDEGGGASPT